ncbi:putative metal-dependent hydrolase [Sphaerochaeta pleomorpha str. Grapes]|uniref:Putative metal-dependent hydrolase n=1 Tax=Sphaerochaeta pleomorpha (strain ATCC BAA-1885 / DSM 22778 / Grapes) TaxID=158190 RepID=G8QYU9_SPHPG|nr:SprT family zinc-dependent metalloprotease [Sphaerochaeta pleomorpha]AEV29726.1 putative metal-dependent hydrolase [Sphaerochaeta pleomorpha str. Grapes]
MKSIGKVQAVTYTLFRQRNCKNVTIRVLSDGSVRVSAPLSVSIRSVERVIEKNYGKLVATVAKQQELGRLYAQTWENGDQFLFWGKLCPLSLIPSIEDSADYENDTFKIRFIGDKPEKEEIRKIIKEMYRSYAQARIGVHVFRWSEILSLPLPPFKVRDSRKRWGSCSAKGTLSFSLRAAALDEGDLSYLVLHEMAHLVHFDHGKKFHAFLSENMPDWKARQKHMFSIQRQSEL